MQSIEADIAIVGGGIAGCVAAIRLTNDNKVVVLESQAQPCFKVGECLPGVASRILQQLDMASGLREQPIAIGMESYWGSPQVEYQDGMRNPDGPGWILDRQRFECFLQNKAKSMGVRFLTAEKPSQAVLDQNRWKIITAKHSVTAKFALDAGGRRSWLSKTQGAKKIATDKLVCRWLRLKTSSENALSTIASCDNGWWYCSPLPDGQLFLAFHTDSDLLPTEFKHSTESFLQEARATPALQERLTGTHIRVLDAGVNPANSAKLDCVVGRQWAALGDAAVSFDPLSSQGMYNAMATAMQFCDSYIAQGNRFNDQAAARYTQQIDSIWQRYQDHHRYFYSLEQRWPNSCFWQRRSRSQPIQTSVDN